MAIRKHAMTKEGAIVAITRKQLKDMGKKSDIQKKFVELYMLEDDKRIGFNEKNYHVYPNLQNAESTNYFIDQLSKDASDEAIISFVESIVN